jgi:hypothetical protein
VPHGTRRSVRSAGLEAYAYQEPETNSKGRERTVHDLGFRRTNPENAYDAYTARTDSRPGPRAVRQANIKDQLSRVLDDVKTGDRVSADLYDGDGRGSQRGSLYKRVSGGALTPSDDGYISSTKLNNNVWSSSTNQNGKGSRNLKQWDTSRLGDDLKRLAAGTIVRRLASHPIAQAAVTADEVIGGVTGKKPSERVGEEFRRTTEAAIRERLKKGQRFGSPVGPLPF